MSENNGGLDPTTVRANELLGKPGEIDYWSIRYRGLEDYNETFQCILNGCKIEEIIKNRKLNGQSASVLDLMGYGYLLYGLESASYLDEGLAVALSNPWDEWAERRLSPPYNWSHFSSKSDFLVGMVQSEETWKVIHKWLNKKRLDGFGIIVCDPGGVDGDTIPLNPQFFLQTVERMYQILSPQNGIMLTVEFAGISKDMLREIKLNINRLPGLQAEFHPGGDITPPVLSIQRSSVSPTEIHILQ